MRRDDDGAIQFRRGVGEVFVQLFPALGAVELVALVHIKTLFNLAALLGDLCFDAINFVADIHAIGDGALVVVFGDEVLVEKADGLLGRRRGEADEEGVEVFEHLPPEIVNGAVTFVGDNEIKRLNGNGGIVGNFLGAAIRSADFVGGHFVGVFGQFLAAQHRVKALDGADGDAADGVERVGGEVLDVVKLGELAPGVGRDELLKLGGGLPSEIRAVHEKKHAPAPRRI